MRVKRQTVRDGDESVSSAWSPLKSCSFSPAEQLIVSRPGDQTSTSPPTDELTFLQAGRGSPGAWLHFPCAFLTEEEPWVVRSQLPCLIGVSLWWMACPGLSPHELLFSVSKCYNVALFTLGLKSLLHFFIQIVPHYFALLLVLCIYICTEIKVSP